MPLDNLEHGDPRSSPENRLSTSTFGFGKVLSNRRVPAASDHEPALGAELDALDGAFVGPVGTLCAGVDVKGLEDIVKAARPHMDWILGHHK